MDAALERIARAAARSLRVPRAWITLAGTDSPGSSALVAPLVSGTGERLGALHVADAGREWTEGDREILRELAGLAAAELDTRREREEQQRSDTRVHQIQRMEAIGRLVGRIAHDFNNLLTTIKGNTDLLLLELGPDAPARPDLEEIQRAADRGASFTRQLLAFVRSQVLQPERLEIQTLIGNATSRLREVLGPGIQLSIQSALDTGVVHADPRQLEQALVHIATNARQAMPQGGEFLLQVESAVLSEDDRRRNPYVVPGAYVLLRATDSGCGMEPEVQARAFEPFFSTRSGRDSGLGLSMVFGVVKQSGGYVWIQSEPGRGTSVWIYLPRVADVLPAEVSSDGRGSTGQATTGGGETVLLVDDEASVRALAERILLLDGYSVLQAGNAEAALRIAARHAGPIHLLLADLVMPRIGGRELARRVCATRPETRVLFASGFTAEATLQPQVLGDGEAFIAKPFGHDELAHKVRAVLDADHAAGK